MASSSLEQEISLRLLNAPVRLLLKDGDDERVATLQDLRSYLEPFGLDITTDCALSWGLRNPIQADHVDKICDLQRQVDDLTLKKAAE